MLPNTVGAPKSYSERAAKTHPLDRLTREVQDRGGRRDLEWTESLTYCVWLGRDPSRPDLGRWVPCGPTDRAVRVRAMPARGRRLGEVACVVDARLVPRKRATLEDVARLKAKWG